MNIKVNFKASLDKTGNANKNNAEIFFSNTIKFPKRLILKTPSHGSMRRTVLLPLILLFLPVFISSVLAYPPSSSDEATMTNQSVQVYWSGRNTYLYVRYPDGTQRTFNDGDIPGLIDVPVGTYLRLYMDRGFRDPGVYTARALAESLNRLPAGEEDNYLSTYAEALTDDRSGKVVATASAQIKDSPPGGFAVGLLVQICDERVQVTVRVIPQTSTTTTTSGGFITLTLINTTSTRSGASSSSSRATSGQSAANRERPPAPSGSRPSANAMSVTPTDLEVTAGDTARFNISTSLSSPKFEIEDLPTGYRYVITGGNGTYLLKIFTHPYSYGRFDVKVIARSGGVELSQGIRLVVRERTTTRSTQSTQSTVGGSGSSTMSTEARPSDETPGTFPTGSSARITTVTQVIIKKEEGGYLNTAIVSMALILALLMAVLLLRRRR